jgi:hypothetical protein
MNIMNSCFDFFLMKNRYNLNVLFFMEKLILALKKLTK